MVNTRTAGSTAYTFMAGGGLRWGFDAPKSRWACNRTIPLQTNRHVVDANLDLARAIGCPVPSSPTLMLYPDAAAGLGADMLLRSVDTPFIILHQGAGHRSKLWHCERWARVADGV